MGKNNAKLPDLKTLIMAGIDPKTGLPLKMGEVDHKLQNNMLDNLSVRDLQDAVNRYTWYNLPAGLTSQMMERILYLRGQAMFFYDEYSKRFYFLPYALSAPQNTTGLDCYGRYTGVTPVIMGSNFDGKKPPHFNGKTYTPYYDTALSITKDEAKKACVILRDYTNGIAEENVARQILQQPILELMSKTLPYLNTALIGSAGVAGLRVDTETDAPEVEAASEAVEEAALTGKKWIAMVGGSEFQDLSTKQTVQAEEFLQVLQSLDNFRKGLYGISNNGVYDKKQYINDTQAILGTGGTDTPLQDGLTIRQEACNIINTIWPVGIWCELSGTDSCDGQIIQPEDNNDE